MSGTHPGAHCLQKRRQRISFRTEANSPAHNRVYNAMPLTLRHPEILRIVRAEGHATVEKLAERLRVTPQTIRRDLGELAREGKLSRVHGGAVPADPNSLVIGYEERRALFAEEKARIARTCAAEVPEGASVFLDVGTNAEAVARELATRRGLTVITNNLNVAHIFAATPEAEVFVAGGVLRRSDGGLVGEATVRAIEAFKLDFAVLGCSALDIDGDMLDFDLREISVACAIMARARRNFLVAEAAKFERSAPARIGSLADVDTLFTDAPPPEPVTRLCKGWGTRIVVAK